MGAWATDAFGNDTACDWAYGLDAVSDLSLVRDTIARVRAVGEDYLDADEACEALAACEVLARLQGRHGFRNAYTETVDTWVAKHPQPLPPELVAAALETVDRILAPDSELLELWDEDGPNPEWHAAMDDLRARLSA